MNKAAVEGALWGLARGAIPPHSRGAAYSKNFLSSSHEELNISPDLSMPSKAFVHATRRTLLCASPKKQMILVKLSDPPVGPHLRRSANHITRNLCPSLKVQPTVGRLSYRCPYRFSLCVFWRRDTHRRYETAAPSKTKLSLFFFVRGREPIAEWPRLVSETGSSILGILVLHRSRGLM